MITSEGITLKTTNIATIWDTDTSAGLVVADAHEFREMRWAIASKLLEQKPFNAGKWQQLDVSESSAHDTYELLNLSLWYNMPQDREAAANMIRPDLPWSEAHFQERISGEPMNPGVEHANWPYHQNAVDLHQNGGRYDHNYMERLAATKLTNEWIYGQGSDMPWTGYRFPTGDLMDVVKQLGSQPGTRQAYVPIFFPEDTGATMGQRVPCTLGYQFIIRDNVLHVVYGMRSCEIYRHFTNDVYMAVRLAQWMQQRLVLEHGLKDLTLGRLTMHITSFHGFVGDTHNIKGFQNDHQH